MMNWVFNPYFLIVIGIALSFIGYNQAFNQVDQQLAEVTRISNLLGDRYGIFVDLPDGTEVLFAGQLAQNPVVDGGNDSRVRPIVQANEMILYRVETWQLTLDNSADGDGVKYRGAWNFLSQNIPPVTVLLDETPITVTAASGVTVANFGVEGVYAAPLEYKMVFDVDTNQNIRVEANPSRATYKDKSLRANSLRVQGFQNGDTVTILGTRTSRTSATATLIHGGTRNDLLQSLLREAENDRFNGMFGLILGGLFVVVNFFRLPFLRPVWKLLEPKPEIPLD